MDMSNDSMLSSTYFAYSSFIQSNIKILSPNFLSLFFLTDQISGNVQETSSFHTESMTNLECLQDQIQNIHHVLRDLHHKLDEILYLKSKPTGCGIACIDNTFKI